MKNDFFISRIGMRGCIGLIVAGIILFAAGMAVQWNTSIPANNMVRCTAVIKGFEEKETSGVENRLTKVDYSVFGEEYTDVLLGQYEASWKVGDTITIYCNRDNPTEIRTLTMQYFGIALIVLSITAFTIAIYKIVYFWRNKPVPEDLMEDMQQDEEEKYRISSFIIPMCAGVPFTLLGLFLIYAEHFSLLGGSVTLLGISAMLAAFISFCNFLRTKLFSKSN